jgi:hypothetical protein
VPDDDPAARQARRYFSALYKLAILSEYERTTLLKERSLSSRLRRS